MTVDEKKKNVMLVDDDHTAHFLTEKIITSLGFARKIFNAFNGLEALNLINAYCTALMEIPEIIIVDLHMPVMGGLEFVEALGKVDCVDKDAMTIVVVSSSVDPADKIRARRLGVEHFITKPISEMKLAAIAERKFFGL